MLFKDILEEKAVRERKKQPPVVASESTSNNGCEEIGD